MDVATEPDVAVPSVSEIVDVLVQAVLGVQLSCAADVGAFEWTVSDPAMSRCSLLRILQRPDHDQQPWVRLAFPHLQTTLCPIVIHQYSLACS